MLFNLYHFNHLENNWKIRQVAPVQRQNGHDASQNEDQIHRWGGGRTRRLLQAAYTIAFLCLLRFDEVLKIQAQDIQFISPTCVRLMLPFRKTDQFGGQLLVLSVT